MKIIYANSKVQKQCSSIKAARQLFGGNTILSISLLSRINALESAVILKDIKDNKPYEPCNIDELAGTVKTVEIKEVSPHYE